MQCRIPSLHFIVPLQKPPARLIWVVKRRPHIMHTLRQPTDKQVQYAAALGIDINGKSFRVLSAEIADTLELKSHETIRTLKLKRGMRVRYAGPRDDMPRELVVSAIGENGYVYFRGTSKYCRPWHLTRGD